MKKILLIIFILTIQQANSQSKKNTIYIDQNNKVIPYEEFKSFNKKHIYVKDFVNDTIKAKQVFFRKNLGSLNTKQHQEVIEILTNLIGSYYDPNKNTMIHYYAKDGEAVLKGLYNKKHWSWIQKNSKKYQSFMIGSKNSGIPKNNKVHIFIDSQDFFNKLFFSKSDFEVNHIFIKPNGEIIVFYGDDDILMILDWSV